MLSPEIRFGLGKVTFTESLKLDGTLPPLLGTMAVTCNVNVEPEIVELLSPDTSGDIVPVNWGSCTLTLDPGLGLTVVVEQVPPRLP